jgi:hypothetical protein
VTYPAETDLDRIRWMLSEDEMDAQREAALDIDEPIPDVPNDPYPLQADDPQPVEDKE